MLMDGRHAVSCVWRGDPPDPDGAGRNHDVRWLRAIHVRVFRLWSSCTTTRVEPRNWAIRRRANAAPSWMAQDAEYGRIGSSRLGARSIGPLRLDHRLLHLMASSSPLNLYRRDNHHDCISRFIDNIGRRERTDG